MRLPNLSFMVRVGQMRAIQAVYEPPELRNPDDAAGRLLPVGQRLGCVLRGRWLLGRMRAQPFYPYVLARTRYYDRVFLDAIDEGVGYIVNIGCGSDTRAHRFRAALARQRVHVLECDQAEAIEAKRRVASRRLGPNPHLAYQPIDLNADGWPALATWLEARRDARMLVMLEGVSPYVDTAAFTRFLDLLATRLKPGSRIAYDFKHDGAAADFGRGGATQAPFRLPADRDAVERFHAAHGLRLDAYETAPELSTRLAAGLAVGARGPFTEDCLLRLTVGAPTADR